MEAVLAFTTHGGVGFFEAILRPCDDGPEEVVCLSAVDVPDEGGD